MPLDPRSILSTRTAFERFFSLVAIAGKEQAAAHPTLRAPVVFGAPQGFPIITLERAVRDAFARMLLSGDAVRAPAEPAWDDGEAWRAVTGVGRVLRGYLGRDAAATRFQPRSFGPQDLLGCETDMQPLRMSPRCLVDARRETLLGALRARALKGDAKARYELEERAREGARELVEQFQRAGVSADTRFYQLGLRASGYLGTHTHNYLRWPRLRRIFGETVLGEMEEPHNICVKVPDDPPSPVFADVTATYMADLRDREEGTQPGVALAQPLPGM